MAKRSKKRKSTESSGSLSARDRRNAPLQVEGRSPLFDLWIPALLAVVTFLVYWPSLKLGFVYDARKEIIEEGFVTSLANLPAVLSLKVLSTNLILGDRPGQMLYLMSIAAVSGKEPFGYHLCSNLLHAANVFLLYVLIGRLVAAEWPELSRNAFRKVQLAGAVVSLIFALHPIAVESVSEVSYSSSLLVTFFTLAALLAAISFRPQNTRAAWMAGAVATFSALAAVTTKESGVTVALALIVYWFLFRRGETRSPWLWFLGIPMAVTAAFLAARFALAPPTPDHVLPLGDSFFQIILVQSRLWVFMMGKLLWPLRFSADYKMADVSGLETPLALGILLIVVAAQGWLATRSRIGALGAALYWLGLATVSNFIPLYRPLADRFYYLPLAGVALQLLAVLLLTLNYRRGFWLAMIPLLGALLPLTLLTCAREPVFASNYTLWSDTVLASPLSATAHNNLGLELYNLGRVDEAKAEYLKALAIDPHYVTAHDNLGLLLTQQGQVDEGISHYLEALQADPNSLDAHYSLGLALAQKGQVKEAVAEYQKVLKISPRDVKAQYNLALILAQTGAIDDALSRFQKVLEIDPTYVDARNNLGALLLQKGEVDEAIVQLRKTLEINPNSVEAHGNLGAALVQKGELDAAVVEFQAALRLKPDYADAQTNLARVKILLQQRARGK